MEISEIREMTTEDIVLQLDESREELMRLRFQRATGELTDHNRLRFTRKRIARLLTVINERKRGEMAASEGEE